MNQEDFINKNLLLELVYFIIATILVSFNIGWIAIALYIYGLQGIDPLIIAHIEPGVGGNIGTNNVNVLIAGFFITSIIWIIWKLRARSVRT